MEYGFRARMVDQFLRFVFQTKMIRRDNRDFCAAASSIIKSFQIYSFLNFKNIVRGNGATIS